MRKKNKLLELKRSLKKFIKKLVKKLRSKKMIKTYNIVLSSLIIIIAFFSLMFLPLLTFFNFIFPPHSHNSLQLSLVVASYLTFVFFIFLMTSMLDKKGRRKL